MSGRDLTRPPLPEPLPAPVVDNHCHLDLRLDGVQEWTLPHSLAQAAAVGVPRIVQIGCELDSARWSITAAAEHEELVAGVALHPNEAPRLAETGAFEDAWAEIAALAEDPRARAVGETGLDYFRTPASGREIQQESFGRHIRLAAALDKTLVIHDRDSHSDVLAILDDLAAQGVHPPRVVMHCFSGDADFARACLARGFWLSFAGTVTFRNARDLASALLVVPADRLLVETDAPFLTPVPLRGRPNASYLVPWTMRFMAAHRGEALADLCRHVEANTFAAYGGAWG